MDPNRQRPIETPIDYAFYKAEAARLRAEAKRQVMARIFAGIRQIGVTLGRTSVRLARAIWQRPDRPALDVSGREAQAAPGRRM